MFCIGGTAAAKDLKLDYQTVMHVRSADSIAVPDDEAHRVGIAVLRGIAIFIDKEVAVHRYEGWFDLDHGSGAFHGHALFTFEDDPTLRASSSGKAESIQPEGVHVETSFEGFTGTGRFENASGEGRFASLRLDAIDKGGATYVKGVLILTVPD